MSIPGTDWCGPYRSDGRDVQNTCGYATARSEFDQSCKDHDCCLDSAGNNPLDQDRCNDQFFMIITVVVFYGLLLLLLLTTVIDLIGQ